ncbi:hypothetical protein AXY43_26415 [Clostridium sp. MF28]|nr:hypothetical protein AXY43_26415 [Clostridium sp. MF28]PSM59383.1 hypothetical protein C4L39_03470 [Clostridium diolis]QES75856.1 hypothetical protein F3K33_24770 [Clostridium diolis]
MGLEKYASLSPSKSFYMKGLNLMTFATWLIKEKGFVSKAQFDSLVNTLPYEGRRKLIIYYKIEYEHYLDTRPMQLEIEIK